MSKFMKVIATLLLILFIATGLANFIPPLAGVTTVVVQEGMASNQKTGSITYATEYALSSLSAGDKIVITDANSAYIYKVKNVSSDWKSIETVADDETAKASETIEVNGAAQKVLFTLPLVGYFSIAMESLEGLIILGMIFVLIILLYIVASVWGRVRSYEDEEDDEEDDFYSDLTKKKVKIDIQEERDFHRKQEAKRHSKDKKAKMPAEDEMMVELEPTQIIDVEAVAESLPSEEDRYEIEKALMAEEVLPEIEMPDLDHLDRQMEKKVDAEEQAAENFEKTLTEEEVPVPAEEPKVESKFGRTDNITNIQDAIAVALEESKQEPAQDVPVPMPEPAAAEEIPDEIELAMPAKTLDELLTEAYVAGDDPKITKDEVTGVSFVDLSDCL